jgi:large subunit ribosomal protein L6
MSHIGKQPIKLPPNVKISIENQTIILEGKEGRLIQAIPFFFDIKINQNIINLQIKSEFLNNKEYYNMWGTFRTLLQNKIIGVNQGWTVKLILVGIGFRGKVEGNTLTLKLGFSHNINYIIPADLKITCIKPTLISIFGIDYEKVTKVAAEIRSLKKTEPYKGKGIRYLNEIVRSKETKKK